MNTGSGGQAYALKLGLIFPLVLAQFFSDGDDPVDDDEFSVELWLSLDSLDLVTDEAFSGKLCGPKLESKAGRNTIKETL